MSNRVLIVGGGRWGSTLAKRLRQPDIPLRVVAVVDEDTVGAAARCGNVVYRHLFRAIADTRPDCAIVATPPSTHLAVATCLAAFGVKRIRIEKPLAMSTLEVDAMKVLEAEIRVGHPMLYSAEAREFANRAGQAIEWFATRWSTAPARHDVPAAWDLGSHDVALALTTLAPGARFAVDAQYGARKDIRITHAESKGRTLLLDEHARTLTVGEKVFAFGGAPDPLGEELKDWAQGGGVPLEVGRRVVAFLEEHYPVQQGVAA